MLNNNAKWYPSFWRLVSARGAYPRPPVEFTEDVAGARLIINRETSWVEREGVAGEREKGEKRAKHEGVKSAGGIISRLTGSSRQNGQKSFVSAAPNLLRSSTAARQPGMNFKKRTKRG